MKELYSDPMWIRWDSIMDAMGFYSVSTWILWSAIWVSACILWYSSVLLCGSHVILAGFDVDGMFWILCLPS